MCISLACRPFGASGRKNSFSLSDLFYRLSNALPDCTTPQTKEEEKIQFRTADEIISQIVLHIKKLPNYDNPKIKALKDALNDKAGEKIGVRSVINRNFNFDNYPDSIALNNPTVNKLIEEIDNSSNDMEMGNNTPRWSGEKNRQLLQN